jgi:hypothetical protein
MIPHSLPPTGVPVIPEASAFDGGYLVMEAIWDLALAGMTGGRRDRRSTAREVECLPLDTAGRVDNT